MGPDGTDKVLARDQIRAEWKDGNFLKPLNSPSQSEAYWHQGPTFLYCFLGSEASQEPVAGVEFPTRPCFLKALNQEVRLICELVVLVDMTGA